MTLNRFLLFCGILGAALFVGMDWIASFRLYPGYDFTAQQVSELSAIGAPSRPIWIVMSIPQAALSIAFAWGVWRASAGRFNLNLIAMLMALFSLLSFLWALIAPMHMRGVAFSATDAMHIVFTVIAVVLMVAYMGIGATAFGRSFGRLTTLTILAMLVAGAIVGTQVPAIAQGQPTPWMGLVERISVYAPFLWNTILALALIRQEATAMPERGSFVRA